LNLRRKEARSPVTSTFEKLGFIKVLHLTRRALRPSFSLTFAPSGSLTRPLFSERRSFRPAARPLRPEANARQRDAPSGAKVFGRSFWRGPPRHI